MSNSQTYPTMFFYCTIAISSVLHTVCQTTTFRSNVFGIDYLFEIGSSTTTLTLTSESLADLITTRWIGVGFGSTEMDGTYAFTFHDYNGTDAGAGYKYSDRILGFHNMGTVLSTGIGPLEKYPNGATSHWSDLDGATGVAMVTRDNVVIGCSECFVFDPTATSLKVIYALGNGIRLSTGHYTTFYETIIADGHTTQSISTTTTTTTTSQPILLLKQGIACMDGYTELTSDAAYCERCGVNEAGTLGSCEQCGSGKQPNQDHTKCVLCDGDIIGVDGYCDIDCSQTNKISNELHVECVDAEKEYWYATAEFDAVISIIGVLTGFSCIGGVVYAFCKKKKKKKYVGTNQNFNTEKQTQQDIQTVVVLYK